MLPVNGRGPPSRAKLGDKRRRAAPRSSWHPGDPQAENPALIDTGGMSFCLDRSIQQKREQVYFRWSLVAAVGIVQITPPPQTYALLWHGLPNLFSMRLEFA